MEQQFGIRELSFGGSFYWFLLCKRFAMSSLTDKTRNRIFSLIEAVFDPMRASFDYLTLIAEKTVLSVLKLRLYSSEQMFNINATF